jgi:hypothetical protein
MNPAAQLLQELASRGVAVVSAGSALHLYPGSAVDPDLASRVQALKPQILALLRTGAVASPAELHLLTLLATHPGRPSRDLLAASRLSAPLLAHSLANLQRRAEVRTSATGRLYLNAV